MNDEIAGFILNKYDELAKQWCHTIGKKYNVWHKEKAKEHLYNELSLLYKKWKNPLTEVTQNSYA